MQRGALEVTRATIGIGAAVEQELVEVDRVDFDGITERHDAMPVRRVDVGASTEQELSLIHI